MINIEIDLSDAFHGVRDQGSRPTCIAFAASDAHAHFYGADKLEYFSPEYAFFFAAQRQLPVMHFAGVRTDALFTAIALDGQPHEQHFPYQSGLLASAMLIAPEDPFPYSTYKCRATYRVGTAHDVISYLQQKVTPILAVNITRAFQGTTGKNSVVEDDPNDMNVGLHALVAVGFGQRMNGLEYVKVRNSWGNGWGDQGYAWLSADYLNRRMNWLATFNPT